MDDDAALYKRSQVGHLARRTHGRAEALLRLQEPLRLLAAERQGHEFLEASIAEAQRGPSFGLPIFCLRHEFFWGHDRIPLLEERLTEFGLERAPREPEEG